MAKECGHTVPCGCKDRGLLTPPPCGDGVDCEGTPCSETFDADCVFYTGETLICGEDTLVEGNTSLADALSAVIAYFCNTSGHVLESDLLCSVTVPAPPEIQVVSAAGSDLTQTLQDIVSYFCNRLNGIDINIQNILTDITNIQGQLITSTSYSFADALDLDGCTTRNHQLQLLAGAAVVSTIAWTNPRICPPTQVCGNAFTDINADTDAFTICRYNGFLDTYQLFSVSPAQFINPPPTPRILSAYNSQTGAANTSGTLNAIIDSIPGNTLNTNGEEFEIDLYLEYNENDPLDLQVGIGAGAIWTRTIQDAEDCKIFIKIIIARIDQNNQLWTITETRENALNVRTINEMEVLYTTKNLLLTENFTVTLINTGGVAGINSLILHRAVLYINRIN